jgi:two-component system, chemotaxis family, response regulator Rcp1
MKGTDEEMINALTNRTAAEILLVEDNENDVELTRIGFKKSKLLLNLHHAKDGVECMEFLRKQGAYAGAPRPDLILLDLNMPRMNGREVLAEIVADQALCNLPVIVLTTSTDDEEVAKMYKLRCSSYIAKPVDLDQFLRVVQSLADYWFTIVVLPVERGTIEAKAVAGVTTVG